MTGVGHAAGIGNEMGGTGCGAVGAEALRFFRSSTMWNFDCNEFELIVILTIVHTVCITVKCKKGRA